MSKPLTFEQWWKLEEWGNCEGILDAERAWDARQPEIDAHKADVARWKSIAVQADEIIEKNDVEIDALRAKIKRVHYGPGTQDEIKHLGEQIQTLLDENKRLTRERGAVEAVALERASKLAGVKLHDSPMVSGVVSEYILGCITPAQSSALEQVKAEARLGAAEEIRKRFNAALSGYNFAQWLDSWCIELEAAAGRKS